MKFKISFNYSIAFLALLFVMHELHEIAHTVTGRIICGCWGLRDFNVWELCQGCQETNPFSVIATIAGPLLSFFMIWLGAYLLKNEATKKKSWGFPIIFANMPFGRLLSALLDSGDEVFVLKTYIANPFLAQNIGILIISLIIFYPLLKSYQYIHNQRKVLWFLGFLILPLILDILLVLVGLNTLLNLNILDDYWVLGSPKLVTYWSIFVLLMLIISHKAISKQEDGKRLQ